jgi:hypothetical protein
LCLLALPDDGATSLVALGAIVGAVVSIAFLVTADGAARAPVRRSRRVAVPAVEGLRPRLVPLMEALRGAPAAPAVAFDGAGLLPTPYTRVVPGHHRRHDVVERSRGAAGAVYADPTRRARSIRSVWVLIAIVYVYLALLLLVVVLSILD